MYKSKNSQNAVTAPMAHDVHDYRRKYDWLMAANILSNELL